ncbi:cupin-like domain-containing protein [Mycobacterium yunnanensis]|uniref:Cupin-like domain-containing protein n=1 Tax=Mycobacterium yunnanensis TaxID=368477 RepID=A0A9X2YZD6_9MYCO|nr:cupin domain-containing protein [Mycobacterium yunnanensis]MCV7420316.1 cupin-like domain-containing protein [Mycobacterium yunnanensis]
MLTRCIGADPQTFAREHWGRLPLLTRAADLPRDFSDLLSVDDVDELLSERGVRAPFIRVAKEGEVLARERYLSPAGFGAEMPDQVDSAKVLDQFASGSTIVLQGLHRLWPPMIDFVRAMVDDLGHPVQANAYVTPPQNRGFDAHYDVHDVFVLQTAGTKHWIVHEPVHPDPLPSQPWTDHRDAIGERVRDEPVVDAVLNPGDALYLPRGWIHSARALGATSVHLTIGVSAFTAVDVVRAVVDQLAADAEFRRSLPMGADLTDQSEMAATATKLIAELSERLRDHAADLGEHAATSLRWRFADRTRPVAVRPLASLVAAENAATTSVRWRPGLVATVRRHDGRVTVTLSDRTISLPESCADALEALHAGVVAEAGSLPGLDAADGEVVIRRLLREAVVVPAGE